MRWVVLKKGVIPGVIKRIRKWFLIEYNTSNRCENLLLKNCTNAPALSDLHLHKKIKWIKDYTCRYVLPDRLKGTAFCHCVGRFYTFKRRKLPHFVVSGLLIINCSRKKRPEGVVVYAAICVLGKPPSSISSSYSRCRTDLPVELIIFYVNGSILGCMGKKRGKNGSKVSFWSILMTSSLSDRHYVIIRRFSTRNYDLHVIYNLFKMCAYCISL